MNRSTFAQAFFWLFGVLTCGYYSYETQRVCSPNSYLWAFFLPLWLIPISNASVLLIGLWKTPSPEFAYIIRSLNGLAIIVSCLLTLVLSPLIFLAIIASIPFLIFAVVPFPPGANQWDRLFALILPFYVCVAVGPLITSFSMRGKLSRWTFGKDPSDRLPLSSCLALIVAIIVIAVLNTALTTASVTAISDTKTFREGLLLLRAVGNEGELLRQCYGEQISLPWFFGGGSSNFDDYESPHGEQLISRETYYRVTGKPFNSSPRPVAPRSSMPFHGFSSFSFRDPEDDTEPNPRSFYYYPHADSDFAGATVGGLVRGLSLTRSSITGWVDPDEAVGNLTWNMRFHGASRGKELRAQILLPPHAVVTGCSLSVKGVKRNAIIGTRDSSREAYTVAASKGEKPLLLSTAGAGRVLLQSSTGWWGTDADLTITIATPLVIADKSLAALPMPMFTERNFEVATKHDILVSSSSPATVSSKSLTARIPAGKGRTDIHGSLENNELANDAGTIYFRRDPSIVSILAEDYVDSKHEVLQQIQPDDVASSTPLVVVVDGSTTMGDWTDRVSDVMKKIQSKNATIVWASDVPRVVVAKVDTTSADWSSAIAKLRDSSCLGGQDNAAALGLAFAQVPSNQSSNVVWIHGSQPVQFFGTDGALSPLKTDTNRCRLFEYQVVPGPNEVVKSLDQCNALTQVPHLAGVQDDLAKLFARLSGQLPTFSITRSTVKEGDFKFPEAKHSAEIAQLNARDQIFDRLIAPTKREIYQQLAVDYHLVTPLTSAIVLEHDADYEAYGVKKTEKSGSNGNDKKTSGLGQFGGLIPTKPEPSMPLLIGCALLMVAMTYSLDRRRKRFV